ncbi:MAG: hypothetical protein LW832_06635 [Parachlamydia sp.]|nr:hypothetical protein [Parachlamydia sp.]
MNRLIILLLLLPLCPLTSSSASHSKKEIESAIHFGPGPGRKQPDQVSRQKYPRNE